jgi:hypothetical protein
MFDSQEEHGLETDEEHKTDLQQFQSFYDAEIAPRAAKLAATQPPPKPSMLKK